MCHKYNINGKWRSINVILVLGHRELPVSLVFQAASAAVKPHHSNKAKQASGQMSFVSGQRISSLEAIFTAHLRYKIMGKTLTLETNVL